MTTSQRLIDVARELFAKRGYSGTSVRDIAARAKANLGAVTYHFGSKEKLYHAVLDNIIAPMRERLAKPIDEDRSALDQIDEYLRATFEFVRRNPLLPRLVIQVLVNRTRKLPPPARLAIEINFQRMTALIRLGQRQGEIRPGSPRHLVLAIAGQPLLHGIYRNALTEVLDFDPFGKGHARMMNDIVEFVIAGLEVRE